MRTYLQAKAMATSLRESLAAHEVRLSHGQCLEIVAKEFGFADWNTLAAKIRIGTLPPAEAGPVSLPAPIPILRISSLEAAREFYVDFLGFEFDWGQDTPGQQPAYAQVSRGEVQLHLAEEGAGGETAALLFRGVGGLTEFHRELAGRRRGFAVTDIRYTPWDSREFEVTDPAGNRLRFWENNPPGLARS